MEDFVIMSIKNFSHAQNYQNWKDMESFIFFGILFFSFYMYTNNTSSLIIVGAHLAGKKGYYVQFVSLIDLIHSF